MFAQDGKFYGYPYCWSAYNLTPIATPRLTQYALASFMSDGTHTYVPPTPSCNLECLRIFYSDAWCQNENNVVLPKYAMRAHTAPLDILFYNGGTNFPSADGNAFVALHGSWDRCAPFPPSPPFYLPLFLSPSPPLTSPREPAAGYSVVQVTFQNGMPVSDTNLLTYKGPGETGNGWIRPAGTYYLLLTLSSGEREGERGRERRGEGREEARRDSFHFVSLCFSLFSCSSFFYIYLLLLFI